MRRYKGLYIDGITFKNEKEADNFLKQLALDAFKRDTIWFYNKPCIQASSAYSDSAKYLVDVYGYTWDQLE